MISRLGPNVTTDENTAPVAVPAISVIIPTRNRAHALLSTVRTLSRQTANPRDYEIIVVADGCADSTAQRIGSLVMPCHLTVIEQPPSGRAAARNRGAAASSAPLLLFLDDDMEAHSDLVISHLTAHARGSETVIIGYFPLAETGARTDIFHERIRSWWNAHFAAQAVPDHQFTFWDFCTGNISLSRDLFNAIGGFDAAFDSCAGEDHDLGLRLLARGVRFRFERAAVSLHHDTPSCERFFARAEAEGAGHVRLKVKHGKSFDAPNLSRLRRLQSVIGLGFVLRIVWKYPIVLTPAALSARTAALLLERAGASALSWRMYELLRGYHYWLGVRSATCTFDAWDFLNDNAFERGIVP
ncbi:MAG: glycosyl transferase family 2 [Bryobacterales bacterium]|nr:glycosyl transferase family 2 [Bryobacterales bacterium]